MTSPTSSTATYRRSRGAAHSTRTAAWVDGSDDLEWQFHRIACALDAEGFEGSDDVLELSVVTADTVRPVVEWWPERWALRRLTVEGAPPSVPATNATLRALAEGELTLSTILVSEDDDAPVMYEMSQATVSVENHRGRDPVWSTAMPGVVRFLGFAETESRLVFDHPVTVDRSSPS